MSTPKTAQNSRSIIPTGFICQYSRKIMSEPVMGLCGHLFEKTIAHQIQRCPHDQTPLQEVIEFAELKRRIELWQAFNTPAQPKSYARAAGGSASSSATPSSSLTSAASSSAARMTVPPKTDGAPIANGRLAQRIQPSASSSSASAAVPSLSSSREIEPFYVVENAHGDDIHGFVQISPNTFVSGSKDTKLKVWDNEGQFLQELRPTSLRKGYKYWVTALGAFSDGTWASGTRDGRITTWSSEGEELWNAYSSSEETRRCKERNNDRINCITETIFRGAPAFYTGSPGVIRLWDINEQRVINEYKTGGEDWIYCIDAFSENQLLAVIGTDLESWNLSDERSIARATIVKEARRQRNVQRAFISAIRRLTHNNQLLAMTLFDGSVKVVDLNTQKITRHYQENEGRVWSVDNLGEQVFASSAEDATIKIWDVREARSIKTLSNNPGRVSAILRISEDVLISGSCHKDPRQEAASIKFWDIRVLTS